jgi:hypothetical protein
MRCLMLWATALNDVNDIAALCEVVDPLWGFEEGDWVTCAPLTSRDCDRLRRPQVSSKRCAATDTSKVDAKIVTSLLKCAGRIGTEDRR